MKDKKVIMAEDNIRVLNTKDILYIESQAHYLCIYMIEESIKIRSKLNEFLEGIEENFLRVHQSFAVNMAYIKRLEHAEIELTNGNRIPISRSKHKEAKEKLINYLEKQKL